ncbi:MAG: hypothetical protein AAFU54_01065 [Chloroflexota bacterium]
MKRLIAFFFVFVASVAIFAFIVSPYTSLEFADAQYYSSSNDDDDDDDDDDDGGGAAVFSPAPVGGFSLPASGDPGFSGFVVPSSGGSAGDAGSVVPPPSGSGGAVIPPENLFVPPAPPPPPPPTRVPLEAGSQQLRIVSGCPLLDNPGGSLIVVYDGEVRDVGRTPDGTSVMIILDGGGRVGWLDIETCPAAFGPPVTQEATEEADDAGDS